MERVGGERSTVRQSTRCCLGPMRGSSSGTVDVPSPPYLFQASKDVSVTPFLPFSCIFTLHRLTSRLIFSIHSHFSLAGLEEYVALTGGSFPGAGGGGGGAGGGGAGDKGSGGSSQYRGVSWHERSQRWEVRVCVYLGRGGWGGTQG